MRNPNFNTRTISGNKVVSYSEAVSHIRPNTTLVTGGFIGSGFPEGLAIALEKRYLDQALFPGTMTVHNLTLLYAGGQGDGSERGLNHLAHVGLLKCVIGGHWGLVPKLQKLALHDQIEAYNLPQGVISQLFRDSAAHRPGLITQVGIGTFVDPRLGGGRINNCSNQILVELITISGIEYLFYKAMPIHSCLLRGTTSDEHGNITMEREALTLDSLAIAMATHNSGGIVIVQVERLAKLGSLNSRNVKIPGILVDYVVLSEKTEHHLQTFSEPFSPYYSGELLAQHELLAIAPLEARKIIARRAALELRAHDIVNLGVGIPECIAEIAAEEDLVDLMTLTAEPGVVGGLPANGLNFGAATNAEAILDQPYQFDFYDGGGLDIAFLGLAQVQASGNLNVSNFNGHLAGAGGFISISQNTKRLVFVGTFCAGKLDLEIINGQINIKSETGIKKFIKQVDQITFNGRDAYERKQSVLYITERCVFRLEENGIELVEIAPGIDLNRDILAFMDFKPMISNHLEIMDARIFSEKSMCIKNDLIKQHVLKVQHLYLEERK